MLLQPARTSLFCESEFKVDCGRDSSFCSRQKLLVRTYINLSLSLLHRGNMENSRRHFFADTFPHIRGPSLSQSSLQTLANISQTLPNTAQFMPDKWTSPLINRKAAYLFPTLYASRGISTFNTAYSSSIHDCFTFNAYSFSVFI